MNVSVIKFRTVLTEFFLFFSKQFICSLSDVLAGSTSGEQKNKIRRFSKESVASKTVIYKNFGAAENISRDSNCSALKINPIVDRVNDILQFLLYK